MTTNKNPIANTPLGSSAGPSIRKAVISDLDELLGLWMGMMAEHEAFDTRIQMASGARSAYRAYMSYHLSQGDSYVSAAFDQEGDAPETGDASNTDPRIVGFCLATVNRNLPMFLPAHYGYLSDIVVHEDLRRAGVGATLVGDVKRWFREKDVPSVQLQVYVKNKGAEAFWRAQGFDPFYVRMWLEL